MSLTLTINQDPNTLVPGQVIEGTAGWRLDDAPRSAVLRLFWYTEGRGTRDVGIVQELRIPATYAVMNGTFRMNVPPMPYSFNGQLIALKWALELLVDNEKLVERVELVVSPWVEQVMLKKVE